MRAELLTLRHENRLASARQQGALRGCRRPSLGQRAPARVPQRKAILDVIDSYRLEPATSPSALRMMETEGLIEAVRPERVVHRPERTIYQITDEAAVRCGSALPGHRAHAGRAGFRSAAGLIFAGAQDPVALGGLLALRRRAVEAESELLARSVNAGCARVPGRSARARSWLR
jgi:hypothetical protein